MNGVGSALNHEHESIEVLEAFLITSERREKDDTWEA